MAQGARGAEHREVAPPPATPRGIVIEPSHRALVLGQTGSGKSVLTSYIGGSFPRVLVIDSKDDDNAMISNAAIARSEKEALAALPGRVVYRPSRDEMPQLAEIVDRLLDKIIRTGGHHAVVIHEIFDLADGRRIGPVLSECYRKGRSLFIPIITCTQRPVDLPRVAVDQVEHVFVFYLMDDRAREAAVPFAGERARMPVPRDYSFLYRGPNDTDCRHVAPIAISRGGGRNTPPDANLAG